MRPRLVDPCRDGTTYPPPTPGANGEGPRYEWRQRMFTGYGDGVEKIPVCDFPSAGDLYESGGMRFSVWF